MNNQVTTNLYQVLSQDMADSVERQLKLKPNTNFGLPTGHSPLGAYKIISERSRSGRLDWSQARCFALDEYLDADEEESFQQFLETNLYQHTNLPPSHRFNPKTTDNYDQEIAKFGGLDLTILGIGTNGHIAFNEPGTIRASYTHCIWLTEATRAANQTYFGPGDEVPKRAVTMGIETILSSKNIILIASGAHKQEVLEKALLGDVNINVPASFLSLHAHVTVLSDFEF
jgi:glucosamine-6-phosphate deaminase